MIRNFFIIAMRQLRKNAFFSAINITGLALGFASSILIFLWVRYEMSVDRFHANAANLYQVYEVNHFDGKKEVSFSTQGLLAGELKKRVPEIVASTGIERVSAPGTQSTLETDSKVLKMEGCFAGESFFQMFSFPVIKGNPKEALKEAQSIALSKTSAERLFGSAEEAIGSSLKIDNKEALLVSAVFEDMPANSTIQYDFVRSWSAFVRDNQWINNWGNTDPATYVQLSTEANPAALSASLENFLDFYRPGNAENGSIVQLQHFPDHYLHASFVEDRQEGGRIEYVRIFFAVAVFIILIACINFVNLSMARSPRRSREVGVRKVIGAGRWSLFGQFIGEAFVVVFLALLLALTIQALALPAFNRITGKALAISWSDPLFWFALLSAVLFTGILSGIYPALVLSGLAPVRVLKNTLQLGRSAVRFRQGLVVFQFSLSLILIVGMLVMYRQLDYIRQSNLGYERENLVYLPIEGELNGKYELFKQKALQLNAVAEVSKMRNSPTQIEHHNNSIGWAGMDPNIQTSFADAVVGYDFAKTLDLTILEGRDFSTNFTDSFSVLLNETAVKKMGLKNPVGATVSWGRAQMTVVGVIKDFHFGPMQQQIEPLIVRHDESWTWGTILVRIKAGQTEAALSGLQQLTRSINPSFPFSYQFSDQAFASLYRGEEQLSDLAILFGMLAISISCLGLLGLAIVSTEQRKKEISIRKVIGASPAGIIARLSMAFLQPVLLANLIALPIAWWLMAKWLSGYAYHTPLTITVLLLAAGIAIFVSMLTVIAQLLKAAMARPITALRNE